MSGQTKSLANAGTIKKESNTYPLLKNILEELLLKITKVNFGSKAGIGTQDLQLRKKHFLICCVEQVIEIAAKNNSGFCVEANFLYAYNGRHWHLTSESEMKSFLGEAAEKMGISKFDARHYLYRDALFYQFMSTAKVQESNKEKSSILINFGNGTFEFTNTTHNLRGFKGEDFLKYILPFDYNPSASAPMFQNFLNQVLPEVGTQQILAEYFGSIFIPKSTMNFEKTLLLYGKGSNGKSVLFEIISAVLGGSMNISNYSLSSLTDEKGYHRAYLANKLINFATELSGNFDAALFKQLVSGEPIEARLPYSNPFILTDYAKLAFSCNEMPRVTEHNYAFFRRFIIVPFNVTINEEDQDRELAKKIIRHELSGVFNWMLEGFKRLLQNKKFTECAEVRQELEAYKTQSDSVLLFLEDNPYQKSVTEFVRLKDLYTTYKDYCKENGYMALANIAFSRRLNALNFQMDRKTFGMAVYAKKET